MRLSQVELGMKYSVALQYANEIVGLLSSSCERIEIGGGIRRGKPEPHDIEIILVPKPCEEFGYATMVEKKIWELYDAKTFREG